MLVFKDPRFNRLGGVGQQRPVLNSLILSFFIRSSQAETRLQNADFNLLLISVISVYQR